MRSFATASATTAMVMLFALPLLSGCSTFGGKNPKFIESGFLTEYSVLRPGREGQFALVYVHEGVDFNSYSKILFEPLTIWLDDSQSSEVKSEDLQKVADGLYFAIAPELRKDWELVTESGEGVMRLRIGLIAIDDADDQLDVYTTVAAHATADSPEPIPESLRGIGQHMTVEIELFDDRSREVLAAAVDRWADTGEDRGTVETWADAHREFAAWGSWFRGRLQAARESRAQPDAGS